MEYAMLALFQLEASQSGGATYRLTMGVSFVPLVASITALFARLF
jgi:hypothetical protein